jgi:hypothetical protein
VISRVQTAGDGGSRRRRFIRLYNPTPAAVPLSGLSIQYKAATGTTYSAFALPSASIPSHGWYLIARSAYNGSPAANATHTAFLMAAAGGNVFLVNGTTALPSASCSASPSIVDKVAYGTGRCPETTVVTPAPAANNSIVRKPGNARGSGQDTDINAADFQAQVPSAPRSASEPPAHRRLRWAAWARRLHRAPSRRTSAGRMPQGDRLPRLSGRRADFMTGAPAVDVSLPEPRHRSATPDPGALFFCHAVDGRCERGAVVAAATHMAGNRTSR